jgi:MtN3 and saliva related transmembrane protein
LDLTEWIGILAGIFTAVSLIPQIVKIVKEKKSENISFAYLAILLAGLALWVVYGVLRKDVPVIATNVTSIVINLVTVFVGLKYRKGKQSAGGSRQ